MKHRITAFLAGIVVLFGLSSCLEVHQAINLKNNGSGTITEEIVMGAQMIAMLEGGLGGLGGEADANPLEELYDEEKYKKQAANYGTGVTFKNLEKIERNGGKGVKVTYEFDNIENVKFSPGSAMDDIGPDEEDAGAGEDEKPVEFKYDKATKVLNIIFPDIPEGKGDTAKGDPVQVPPVDPAAEAMMMQMFKDMKVSATINIVDGIKDSEATHTEGNVITLMEMNFGEIVKNPKGLQALQKMEDANRAEMQKALENVKGVKFETKPKVKVTLK